MPRQATGFAAPPFKSGLHQKSECIEDQLTLSDTRQFDIAVWFHLQPPAASRTATEESVNAGASRHFPFKIIDRLERIDRRHEGREELLYFRPVLEPDLTSSEVFDDAVDPGTGRKRIGQGVISSAEWTANSFPIRAHLCNPW
jgi:hypothetical protein